MDQTQVNRIMDMEQLLNSITAAIRELEASLEHFEQALPLLQTLTAYYQSEQWQKDYNDDGAGKLPANLRRGVLAQDTVYDLLDDVNQLRTDMLILCKRLQPADK